jgi:hypothetical protein
VAVRGDIHVEWYRSPRVIIVEAPSVELDIQDLVDTMVEIEAALDALDNPSILKSAGKQPLTTGAVGITVTLNNAQVAFEARALPVVSGTATSNTQTDGLPGQILEDTGADFSSVKPGDAVLNTTDKSRATIIEVIDSTHIRHYALAGGTSNNWTIGDGYKVYAETPCVISGGNLTAVDDIGDPLQAVLPALGVSFQLQQSTSPSIVGVEGVETNRYLQELLRPGHPALGNVYYWDPVNGDDGENGEEPNDAVKTFARAHQLVTAYNFDAIICLAGNPAGTTIADDRIVVTKATTIIRGPGRSFRLQPSAPGNPTVSIAAPHVSLSEIDVYSAAGGTDDGILISADDALLQQVNVWNVTGNGIRLTTTRNTNLWDMQVHDSAGDGIKVDTGVYELQVKNVLIEGSGGDGIAFDGTAENILIDGLCRILGSGGWGLDITSNASYTTISGILTLGGNTSGDINDNGSNACYAGQIIIDAVLTPILAQLSDIETNLDAVAADVIVIRAFVAGRWKIDTAAKTMTFYAEDNTTVVGVFNLKNACGQPAVDQVTERVRVP